MALPGETITHPTDEDIVLSTDCIECGRDLPIEVLQSNAGYYVGTFCSICGPHSRETGYYATSTEAQADLDTYKTCGLFRNPRLY